ncbi:MAG: signal recognition particle receptor subunit alpha, partial [Gammaproteobacteria bacterium]
MFDTLTERLNGALKKITGRGRITEDNVRDTVRQIRMALLEADVALPVVKRIVERVRQRALGTEVARSLNPGQTFVKIVHDELVHVLGRDQTPLRPKGRPAVLLLVGLQGAGKTTTAGKLARYLSNGQTSEVLLVSTDVYRPAAREQLETIARDIGAGYVRPASDNPREIALEALAEARRRASRWLIVDTAGRLHVDDEMMAEVRELHAAIDPSETLFIVDAMLGQD